MIKLTRLSGEPFVVNAEMIRTIEQRPDTFVTMTTGDRVVVQETMEDVIARCIEYQRQKHWMPAANVPAPLSGGRVSAGSGSVASRR